VADVTTDSEGVIATNRTGRRCQRVRSSKHRATRLDSFEAFPNHSGNWTGRHVFDHSREERFALVFRIILRIIIRSLDRYTKRSKFTVFKKLGGRLNEFEGHQLVAALLESGNDFADQPALDAIRLGQSRQGWTPRYDLDDLYLDHDESAFVDSHLCFFFLSNRFG